MKAEKPMTKVDKFIAKDRACLEQKIKELEQENEKLKAQLAMFESGEYFTEKQSDFLAKHSDDCIKIGEKRLKKQLAEKEQKFKETCDACNIQIRKDINKVWVQPAVKKAIAEKDKEIELLRKSIDFANKNLLEAKKRIQELEKERKEKD